LNFHHKRVSGQHGPENPFGSHWSFCTYTYWNELDINELGLHTEAKSKAMLYFCTSSLNPAQRRFSDLSALAYKHRTLLRSPYFCILFVSRTCPDKA